VAERILLSVRAEDRQLEAVRYALALCRETGARLTVLAVARELTSDTHWLCVQEKLREEARAGMLPALEAVRALAEQEGVECGVAARVGDFYTEIESYAAREHPHLVIVACPPARNTSLRLCHEAASDLRGRLECPVVSLVAWAGA
jgi:nucleotide-binding universal stress UspA family protein